MRTALSGLGLIARTVPRMVVANRVKVGSVFHQIPAFASFYHLNIPSHISLSPDNSQGYNHGKDSHHGKDKDEGGANNFSKSKILAAAASIMATAISSSSIEEAKCFGVVPSNEAGTAAQVGAGLFALWGILHVYVGVEGLIQFLTSPAKRQWEMVIGGSNAQVSSFKFPADPLTAKVHSHLIANFTMDVGGYGILGLVIAWMIFTQASWTAYFIGLGIIGLCDLSFAFLLVHSGIIRADIYTIGGPIIWILAVLITPLGLPSLF